MGSPKVSLLTLMTLIWSKRWSNLCHSINYKHFSIQLSLCIFTEKINLISGRALHGMCMTRLYACRLRKIYSKREGCTKNLITWTHSWKKFTFHGWIPSRATISLSQRSDSDRFMIKCCSRASRFWNDRLRTLLPKTDLVCIVFMKDI